MKEYRLFLLYHSLQPFDIVRTDFGVLRKMLNEWDRIATEQPVNKVVDRPFDDRFLLHDREEDVRLAPDVMLDVAFLFEPTQQRLDRPVGNIPSRGQTIVDFLDRGFLELPDQSQDFGLGGAHTSQFSLRHGNPPFTSVRMNTVHLYALSRKKWEIFAIAASLP